MRREDWTGLAVILLVVLMGFYLPLLGLPLALLVVLFYFGWRKRVQGPVPGRAVAAWAAAGVLAVVGLGLLAYTSFVDLGLTGVGFVMGAAACFALAAVASGIALFIQRKGPSAPAA